MIFCSLGFEIFLAVVISVQLLGRSTKGCGLEFIRHFSGILQPTLLYACSELVWGARPDLALAFLYATAQGSAPGVLSRKAGNKSTSFPVSAIASRRCPSGILRWCPLSRKIGRRTNTT